MYKTKNFASQKLISFLPKKPMLKSGREEFFFCPRELLAILPKPMLKIRRQEFFFCPRELLAMEALNQLREQCAGAILPYLVNTLW